jgi:hypothetical protein
MLIFVLDSCLGLYLDIVSYYWQENLVLLTSLHIYLTKAKHIIAYQNSLKHIFPLIHTVLKIKTKNSVTYHISLI